MNKTYHGSNSNYRLGISDITRIISKRIPIAYVITGELNKAIGCHCIILYKRSRKGGNVAGRPERTIISQW